MLLNKLGQEPSFTPQNKPALKKGNSFKLYSNPEKFPPSTPVLQQI
jgi:hypothetical protein